MGGDGGAVGRDAIMGVCRSGRGMLDAGTIRRSRIGVPKGNGEGQSMFGQFWARHHGEARQGSVFKRAGREGGK